MATSSETRTTFATRLRSVRRGTQKEVATDLELAEATLSNWEKGISRPSVDDIVRLCDYYHCSADYLLGRIDERDGVTINNVGNGSITNNSVNSTALVRTVERQAETIARQAQAIEHLTAAIAKQ